MTKGYSAHVSRDFNNLSIQSEKPVVPSERRAGRLLALADCCSSTRGMAKTCRWLPIQVDDKGRLLQQSGIRHGAQSGRRKHAGIFGRRPPAAAGRWTIDGSVLYHSPLGI